MLHKLRNDLARLGPGGVGKDELLATDHVVVADGEDLHDDFVTIGGVGDGIEVTPTDRGDALFLDDLFGGTDAIAKGGGPLELEVAGSGFHCDAQAVQGIAPSSFHEMDQVLDRCAVGSLVDCPHAWRAAPLDMEKQACTLVGAIHVQGAGPELEEALEVLDGLTERCRIGVGTEVAGTIVTGATRGADARIPLVH